MSHVSDSEPQRLAEPLILAAVADQLGVELEPRTLYFPNGARVDIDGVDEAETVFVEVFARQGRLKGGQKRKVALDAFKLITLARTRQGARVILAFADDDAAAEVRGKSWLAEAVATWDVEVIVIELDEAVREGLRSAQARQTMANVSDADQERWAGKNV